MTDSIKDQTGTELIQAYPYKVDSGEVHPVTKAVKWTTTYHTERDGKGDLVTANVGSGEVDTEAPVNSRGLQPQKYYAVKIDGVRVMDKDIQAMFVINKATDLTNKDLWSIKEISDRCLGRMIPNRKAVKKLTDEDKLYSEDQQLKMLNFAKALVANLETALFTPLTGGGGKGKKEPVKII